MACFVWCNIQMEDTVMEAPLLLVEADGTKVSEQGHSIAAWAGGN